MNEENPSPVRQSPWFSWLEKFIVDFFFGILWPLFILWLDPGILKSLPKTCGGPYLGPYAAYFVYPAVFMGMALMLAWIFARDRLIPWGRYITGIFLLGVLLAGALGVPLVIFFFFAWAPIYPYLRNAVLAWKLAPPIVSLPTQIGQALLGAMVFALAILLIGLFFIGEIPPRILPACPPMGD